MIDSFFDSNITNSVVQASLKGHDARHRSIVNNIANVDTPGYRRIEATFEKQLEKAVDRMRSGSQFSQDSVEGIRKNSPLDGFEAKVRIDSASPLRADGSNVSIDREMAELSKNSGKIVALTELMIRNYSQMKSAIRGRNA